MYAVTERIRNIGGTEPRRQAALSFVRELEESLTAIRAFVQEIVELAYGIVGASTDPRE